MNKTIHQNYIDMSLDRHELVTLPKIQPETTIECKEGVLWLTKLGDFRDYILIPGDRYTPPTKGNVMIQAMRAGTFTITNN